MRDILALKDLLRLTSDTNRLRILCLLTKKERCVCEIFEALQLPQNLVSHHLSKLKSLSLVEERREGTFIIYRVNKKAIDRYRRLFDRVIKDQKI